MNPDWLEDIDIVTARFTQARAVVEMLVLLAQPSGPEHDIIGTGLVAEACDAADDLLRQGQHAFKRIEQRIIEARTGAR